MGKKRFSFYLLKVVRVSGWILLVLMLIFIGTGFALCGQYGFNRLIDSERALWIHNTLAIPLVIICGAHALSAVYFALRRWKWKRIRKADSSYNKEQSQ